MIHLISCVFRAPWTQQTDHIAFVVFDRHEEQVFIDQPYGSILFGAMLVICSPMKSPRMGRAMRKSVKKVSFCRPLTPLLPYPETRDCTSVAVPPYSVPSHLHTVKGKKEPSRESLQPRCDVENKKKNRMWGEGGGWWVVIDWWTKFTCQETVWNLWLTGNMVVSDVASQHIFYIPECRNTVAGHLYFC